ncbi:MAG: TetR/AcrR family transcriptional regulator [Intrasporangiaceae bacterium]|nr:TetR/AcrR family transcriptional regulator [Intrasporangiaceae bacterium]
MTVDGIRARNRAAIEAEILRVGGEHLAHSGAAALSLRAVARDLGMAPSALYRYFADRDDLLTLLIVAAYDSLADFVERNIDEERPPDALARFRTISRSTRTWARANPHHYALIYGSPVPDYEAPAQRTNTAGTRVPRLLLGLLAELPVPSPDPRAEEALAAMLADPDVAGVGIGAAILQRGLTAWMLVLGAVSTELFEGFGHDGFGDADLFFEGVLDAADRIVTG